MLKTASQSLFVATVAYSKALDPAQASEYSYMDEAMRLYGQDYGWRAHEAVTNDGYILTMFRIESDQNGETVPNQGSKGPILLQHGFGTDSISWFHVSDESKPALPVRLFQEGFDVWLGNNRGTRLSRKHVSMDADKDQDYWDFSHHEFGAFDVPTMAKKIVQVNHTCTKVSYLGHSLGTTQMFYGLGRGKYMQSYFSQVVALAPCFIPSSENFVPDFTKQTYVALAGMFEGLDIESLFGPHWDEQVEVMCTFLGKTTEYCALLQEVQVGPIAGGEITGVSEIGVQQLQHLGQVALDKRFQYYEEAYVLNDLFGIKGQLVEVHNIEQPPFSFIYIDGDKTCQPEDQQEYMLKMPAYESHTTIIGRDHAYVVGDNDDEFFELLLSDLQHSNRPLSYADCDDLINH